MGFGLRKSFKVGGVRFNLSKSGVGASIGVKGFRTGISSSGKSYTSVSKGMLRKTFYTKTSSKNLDETPKNKTPNKTKTRSNKWYSRLSWQIFVIFIFPPVGIWLVWKFSNMNIWQKILITSIAIFWLSYLLSGQST